MRIIGLLLPLLGMLALRMVPAAAQSIELDPPRVYEGDVTRLNIKYESEIPSLYALDTEMLERDFEVLRLNSRVSRITDRQTAGSRMEWTLELAPRRSGLLAIPPIRLGDNLTPPASLRVEPRDAAANTRNDVFVRLEANPPNPYPTQQTRVSMILYHAAPFSGGRWHEPQTDAGKILHSGYETAGTVTIDGVDYRRTIRSLALFPSTEGLLELTPAAVIGDLRATTGNDPDRLYRAGRVRTLYRRSEPLRLEVQPLPAEHASLHWLPAFGLTLSQEWDEGATPLAAGDTLQRTIIIEARGLPADSLPADLLVEPPGSTRVFADQPVRGNRFDADILVGRLRQSFAVLLTRAGDIELPPVELTWWDLNSDRARTARLPGRVIRVAVTGNPALDGFDSKGQQFSGLVAVSPPGILQKTIVAGLILALYLAWLGFGERLSAMLRDMLRRRLALQQLYRACCIDDAPAARSALLIWARQQWPDRRPAFGLVQILERLPSSALQAELIRLDAAIYGVADSNWQGRGLWLALRKALRMTPAASQAGATTLPGLYPGFASVTGQGQRGHHRVRSVGEQ